MKSVFKLSGFIVIMALFSACFSPWAGDPGVVTITFGDGGQEAARSAVTREEIPTLTHIITLYGNGTPVTATLIGAGTIVISVPVGNWNIRVRAESPEPAQTLRALGFGQVRVVAGQDASAAIYMVSATEVANHAQLAAAINTARTDGGEKIIVVMQDIYAAAQLTIGADRNITLASDSNVAIRRGAGFGDATEMFVMQGNATLRLGRYGINGSVYVQGATGAVLPPLERTLPGDPTDYTKGLAISGGVLTGRGDAIGNVIVIPHGVISIANNAFRDDNLIRVTIPSSVTNIGNHAFRYNNLESVTIPNSVTTIGLSAFRGNNLENVTIPGSVTTITESAFRDNNLTSVTIPYGVTTIGVWAFMGNRLTSVTIPNSVTTIGNGAFEVNRLTNVTISNNVTSIGDYTFGQNRLTRVTIPNRVTTIGIAAFSYNNLTTITIPANVAIAAYTSMGDYGTAFFGYYNIVYQQQGGTFVWNGANWSRQ